MTKVIVFVLFFFLFFFFGVFFSNCGRDDGVVDAGALIIIYDGMGIVIHGMHNDFVDVVFEVICF
jgi:hypothetical protein